MFLPGDYYRNEKTHHYYRHVFISKPSPRFFIVWEISLRTVKFILPFAEPSVAVSMPVAFNLAASREEKTKRHGVVNAARHLIGSH